MVTIAIAFTAGRYSATPWGRHVNEGAIEWPPSPWRFLRALVAVWKNTMPDLPHEQAAAVLAKLASPPQFALPPATTTHTRHYMPMTKSKPGLVFDASVVVDRRTPVVLCWPEVELAPAERALLTVLLGRLPYLGRAESWCAAVLQDDSNCPQRIDSYPLLAGQGVDGDVEVIDILTALAPLNVYDLMATTDSLRASGSDPRTPPGAHWQRYARPRGCFSPSVAERRQSATVATVARYRLVGPVTPTVFRTLAVAEAMRRAAMSMYGRRNGDSTSRLLSGKAVDGAPLTGHQHASYLPVDEDGDGRLDHLIVWAPGGLNELDQDALGSLETLRVGRELVLKLVLTYLGGEREMQRSRLFGCSRIWMSLTPFMLSRHPKTHKNHSPRLRLDGTQIDSPEDQIRRELSLRGLPAPQSIERILHGSAGTRRLSWQDFQRWCLIGSPPADTTGFGYAVAFEDEIEGPLLLGYGSHFGLGIFGHQRETPLGN